MNISNVNRSITAQVANRPSTSSLSGYKGAFNDGFASAPRTSVEPPPDGYNPNAPLPRAWTITSAALSGAAVGGIGGSLLASRVGGPVLAAALAVAGGIGAGWAAAEMTRGQA